MTMRSQLRTMRLLTAALLSGAALASLPDAASAQFGRNKVQFDDFDFRVMQSDHFDWHFYAEETEAVPDVARMGERWYERYARTFQHEFEEAKPVILYADHPDFQQTNTLQGFVGEGTGGVTESLKNRVIMPLTGSYWDTDHVLGHEIVHAFQYNIAQARPGGFQGLATLPLWLIEGMAEYLSVGRDDPLTAMWIRDAIRRDELPTIRQMTRESRFFPYRFGQALWAYIGGRYGDDAVVEIYRRSLRVGFESAITQVIGMSTDTLSVRWKEQVARDYQPLLAGRAAPADQGRLLFAPSTGGGRVNTSPVLSPDGRFVAFLSEKDLFSVDLYMADVATGRIIRKLSSADSDPHVEALRYIDSSGSWSPDSRRFAYVVVADGDNQLVIVDSEEGEITDRIGFDEEGIGSLANPAWSPDGRYIAFSGTTGGISDLFLYDLQDEETVRLTDDKYADLQPTWSPDGRALAFTSDRGPETNFENLSYSRFQLATIDVATRTVRVIPVFGNAKHINPQYSADGSRLYFISDQDGFSDIYEVELGAGTVRRITNLITGVSGHTYLAPAMSVSNTGLAAYTVFDSLEFHVYTVDVSTAAAPVMAAGQQGQQPGRLLSPINPDRFSRVSTYLADARTGLLPSDTFQPEDAEGYSPGLSLDYLGQPSIGVGTDTYGSYVGGGTSAFFSDMLGDKSLGVAIQAQGTFKDIGGTAFYSDLDDRWNWGVGAGRIPYLIPFAGIAPKSSDPICDADAFCQGVLEWTYYRQFVTTALGQVAYPFSQTQRLELGMSATRYSYDIEVDKLYLNSSGFPYAQSRESRDAPDPLNMFSGSVSIVGDNSFFGFVSPIRGTRYRFEVEQTLGTVDFTTVIADYRRYYAPSLNLTVGLRALHFGRYGLPGSVSQGLYGGPLTPLFLGYETLIRGYAWESFDVNECVGATQVSSCPTVDRLIGNRIAVGSLEARIPLLGVEQYGLINFPFVPTELVLFTDAGVAWDSDSPPTLEWSTSSVERVPVVSSGVSARVNILGVLILETYYAYPWQRPLKGWHWGFNLAPGW